MAMTTHYTMQKSQLATLYTVDDKGTRQMTANTWTTQE